MTKFIETEAKSILTKYKFRDNWFWNRYGINPYRGCPFVCNYCDAITEKYLVHESYEDFSRVIYVKKNAPEVLEKEVKKLKRDVVAMSGVTVPYQPAERKYELTRKLLEILAEHKFPVHIITKSDLVLRDVDLLRESIRDIYKRGKMREIPGVGANIASVIQDFLVTGKSERLNREIGSSLKNLY